MPSLWPPRTRTLAVPLATAAMTVQCSFFSLPASAARVVGGSDLLDTARAAQLEAWLDGGPIDLVNVFDKQDGDTALDFHAAADGRGATFTVIEVLSIGGAVLAEPLLIGGYNPRSWNSTSLWNYSHTPEERTAFLFDLGAGTRFDQRRDFLGLHQTYNLGDAGPGFGIGGDLVVRGDLVNGSSSLYTYGSDAQRGRALTMAWHGGHAATYRFGRIEVFTVQPTSPVPEPASALLGLAGGLLLWGVARRRGGAR